MLLDQQSLAEDLEKMKVKIKQILEHHSCPREQRLDLTGVIIELQRLMFEVGDSDPGSAEDDPGTIED